MLVVGGCAYAWNLNHQLDSIKRIDTSAIGTSTTADSTSTSTSTSTSNDDSDTGKAINILVLGSDKASQKSSTDLAEDAAATTWPAGKYRSDTIMVVHVSADRTKVTVASIPRDTLTTLYNAKGEAAGTGKINAAFSMYGPLGAMSTVEHLTGVTLNHLAIIDWTGFVNLSTAVGGVRVYVPQTVYDSAQDITWTKGWHTLQGKQALAYVRERHGLARGDFDRIARQQNFIRLLLGKMMSDGVTKNPITLQRTVSTLAKNLVIDSSWSTSDLRGLALSLRSLSTSDITFVTAPVASTPTTAAYGDVVMLDPAGLKSLFTAMNRDQMAAWVKANPDSVLGSSVS